MKWLQILPEAVPEGAAERRVASVTADSRKVVSGALFFALSGYRLDGHAFIEEALAAGAVGVVAEREMAVPPETPMVVHPQARSLFGQAAARLYGNPSQSLPVIAVTGTNGKTTVAWLVSGLFERGGFVGTLGWGRPGALKPACGTTPDPVTLQKRLDRMRQEGLDGVALEASSHGLVQERLAGSWITGAVWTNLSPEHLDYHGDLAAYRRAKRRLFERPELGFAVVNADDPEGEGVAGVVPPETSVWCFGWEGGDVRAVATERRQNGLRLQAETPKGPLELCSSLVGSVNAANLLAAATVGLALGLSPSEVGCRLSRIHAVPGRMEDLERTPSGAQVWVDYAHTADALERILLGARELVSGKLWCVFGAGGDRDREKRPAMGAVAERLCDRVVLTSDNPRGEAPETIMAGIAAGMEHLSPRRIPDREAAIVSALEGAGPGDGVVVAGKGHESQQEMGGQIWPFSDREVVSRWQSQAWGNMGHDDTG